MTPSSRLVAALTSVTLMFSLAACGGGKTEPTSADAKAGGHTAQGKAVDTPSADASRQLMARGAELNRAELLRASKQAAGGADAGKAMVQAAASSLVTAYRFYNTETGAHFYTISETERDNVRNTLPQFSYEGPAFYVSPVADTGLSPVYRFFNTQTGVHFYTISEEERALIQQSLPQLTLEGVAYYASKIGGVGYTPLFRFYLSEKGFHFYTISEMERDNVDAFLGATYRFEGVGYYVGGEGESFSASMARELNEIRIRGGWGGVEHSVLLDQAARNHSNYLFRNFYANGDWDSAGLYSLDPATGLYVAHTESPALPGFTGVLNQDRDAAVGYAGISLGDFPLPRYVLGESFPYRGCLREFLSTVYHRDYFFRYVVNDFGSSVVFSPDKIGIHCNIHLGLDAGRVSQAPDGWVGVYPFSEETDVTRAMGDGSGEAPDPVPSMPWIKGNPVTIYIRPYGDLSVTSFELRDSSNVIVSATILTSVDSTRIDPWIAHLVPLFPLKEKMRYTAHFVGARDGVPLSKTWSFTTR